MDASDNGVVKDPLLETLILEVTGMVREGKLVTPLLRDDDGLRVGKVESSSSLVEVFIGVEGTDKVVLSKIPLTGFGPAMATGVAGGLSDVGGAGEIGIIFGDGVCGPNSEIVSWGGATSSTCSCTESPC